MDEQLVSDAVMLRHALASLVSIFKFGSKKVEREYIKMSWLDAQGNKEVVKRNEHQKIWELNLLPAMPTTSKRLSSAREGGSTKRSCRTSMNVDLMR